MNGCLDTETGKIFLRKHSDHVCNTKSNQEITRLNLDNQSLGQTRSNCPTEIVIIGGVDNQKREQLAFL